MLGAGRGAKLFRLLWPLCVDPDPCREQLFTCMWTPQVLFTLLPRNGFWTAWAGRWATCGQGFCIDQMCRCKDLVQGPLAVVLLDKVFCLSGASSELQSTTTWPEPIRTG